VHHGEGLRRLLTARKVPPEEQDALVAALGSDVSKAEVSPADAALLAYVSKLTRSPEDIEASDVESLRAQGFDDRAIHDICVVAAYYAFVNRIADGLGVELEARW
jgi:uncharacterized peroxidase-related enzyme